MDLTELDYELPPELIAQHPAERRDASRLLVYERATGDVRHRRFDELPDELAQGTLTVVNDTRVLPGRLRLRPAQSCASTGSTLRTCWSCGCSNAHAAESAVARS